MKFIVLIELFLFGCSSYPVQNQGIIHDYIFQKAEKECYEHGGLHYIISMQKILGKHSESPVTFNDYPCETTYKIRCQDKNLFTLISETTYCFISQNQIEETTKQ